MTVISRSSDWSGDREGPAHEAHPQPRRLREHRRGQQAPYPDGVPGSWASYGCLCRFSRAREPSHGCLCRFQHDEAILKRRVGPTASPVPRAPRASRGGLVDQLGWGLGREVALGGTSLHANTGRRRSDCREGMASVDARVSLFLEVGERLLNQLSGCVPIYRRLLEQCKCLDVHSYLSRLGDVQPG